jgi:hypothetical protein
VEKEEKKVRNLFSTNFTLISKPPETFCISEAQNIEKIGKKKKLFTLFSKFLELS